MNPVACPICQQSEPVIKVSAVYIAALELRHGRKPLALDPDGAEGEPPPQALKDLPAPGLALLGKRLAPPSTGRKAPTRPLNPDLVVAVFSLVGLVFIYQIYLNQAETLPFAIAVWAAFFVFYFWQRRRLVAKYEALIRQQQEHAQKIERAIQRWMGLYYCVDDDVVFTIAGHNPVPADRLNELLFK